MKIKLPLLIWLCLYGLLHILGWIGWMFMNDNENWATAARWIYGIVFMPLNILNYFQMRLTWGTSDILHARFTFGIIGDFCIMTIVSVYFIYFSVRLIQRLKHALVAPICSGSTHT